MGMVLSVLLAASAGYAGLSELEGTHGHAKPGDASALEGGGPVASPPEDLAASAGDGIVCQPGTVCMEASTQLPLRVLPRPFANLYRSPESREDAVVMANLPAFRPLYVFAREGVDLREPANPTGWYSVGRSRQSPEGWMQAKDLMEWRQSLLVSYTHPGSPLEGRRPVLMFRDKTGLKDILNDLDMSGRAGELYKTIDAGGVPDGVVSTEPKRFVDITRQFYVLPILQWEEMQIAGDDVRLVQLAAAVPRSRGADTLENEEFRRQAQVERTAGSSLLQEAKVDVVFVIDTTRSMQPFIDMTRDAVAAMAGKLSAKADERFRFGLVVFRDSLKVAPGLEYVAQNLTPQLISARELAALLEGKGGATEVGSVDYAEEVFAGVDLATRSQWRDGAMRFMILLGDASSHPKGHSQNTTGKDEVDLRRELDDAQIHLFAIHLQDPRATEDHPIALSQFSHLSRIRGTESTPALVEVNAFAQEDYRTLVDTLTAQIMGNLKSVTGGEPAENAPSRTVEEFDKLWEAALIEYLGQEAAPPKDIVAWTIDRDLSNPAMRSLDVRVLVTREQLSTLAQVLDQVVQALMRAEVTQSQFFEALQSVAGQAMKRPEDLAGATRLADTGLLPAFIQSLPYKSNILALSDEMFASMTAEQRSQLEWSILAKLDQYRVINEQVDAWFRINDLDSDQDLVYPLHIDYLP